MKSLSWALSEVDRAPTGPRVAAFFDLDGTIVQGFTAFAFLRESVRRGDLSMGDLLTIARQGLAYRQNPDTGLDVLQGAVAILGGRELADLRAVSKEVFAKRIAPTIRPDARELIRAHQRAGHTVVLSTAATSFQAYPVAEDLGIEHVLSTEVEVEEGYLTGRLSGAARWGAEKARAVTEFIAAHDIEGAQSFAYGNGAEDWDFLHSVGHPVAVRPDRGLARRIRGTEIPALNLADPPGAGVSALMGTLGAVSMFNLGVAAAVTASAFVSRQGAFDLAAGPTADWSLAAAGIRLNIIDAHYIEQARPAIVMFNHQSNLDPVIVATLLRRQFTGIGKIELQRGVRGAAFRFLGIAFVDRGHSEAAKASVNALVDRIRAGESVLIAPEGTRMPTERLGRFKKGGFHLALQARVPVLPIVVRNTGAHWPRRSALVRPGRIDVRVLPPVDTSAWERESLDTHVEEVREGFDRALAETWA